MPEKPVLTERLKRVHRFAIGERLFRRVSRVLVAVSGGPDSLALLLILRELKDTLGFEIEACHFDHQLRAESRADLERVRAICDQLGVSCVTGEGDVRSAARQERASIEEMARKMRYQFLAFVAGKERCDAIATGHTADDQAETVLMRILRGSGVRGIRGMLPLAETPGAPGQRLVRPILCLGREETLAVCREAGIEPVIDASNQDLRLLRNRLRCETLPALRTLNPSVGDALRGLAASAREVFATVEHEAMALQPGERLPAGAVFELNAFRALQAEARLLVIEREASFFKLQPEVNRTRLENLGSVLSRGAGEVRFGDTAVEASCGKVRVGPPRERPKGFEPTLLNIPGVTVVGGWRVEVRMNPAPLAPGAVAASIDPARVAGALRLRTLRSGDRMVFQGIERTVRDAFSNEKVPRWERAGAVAVADSARVLVVFTADRAMADRANDQDAWRLRASRVEAQR